MARSKFYQSLFSLLRKEKVISILNFMKTRQTAKFMEISRSLNIKPSTLEYHLQQISDCGLLTHEKNTYLINGFTRIVDTMISSVSSFEYSNDFFSSHLLSIPDESIKKLINVDFKVEDDLLKSYPNLTKKFQSGIKTCKIAGIFDPNIEKKALNSFNLSLKDINIDFVLNAKQTKDLIHQGIFRELLSFVDIEKFQFNVVFNELNFLIVILDNLGLLFLPNLNGDMDYMQWIRFESPSGIKFLTDLFEDIKRQSKRVYIKNEILEKPKNLIQIIEEFNNYQKEC